MLIYFTIIKIFVPSIMKTLLVLFSDGIHIQGIFPRHSNVWNCSCVCIHEPRNMFHNPYENMSSH
eukprot:UN02999